VERNELGDCGLVFNNQNGGWHSYRFMTVV